MADVLRSQPILHNEHHLAAWKMNGNEEENEWLSQHFKVVNNLEAHWEIVVHFRLKVLVDCGHCVEVQTIKTMEFKEYEVQNIKFNEWNCMSFRLWTLLGSGYELRRWSRILQADAHETLAFETFELIKQMPYRCWSRDTRTLCWTLLVLNQGLSSSQTVSSESQNVHELLF